jgi:hypothetical protein
MSTTATDPQEPLYTRAEAAEVGAQRLSFRWPLPQQLQSVALGGKIYRLRATYRDRLGSWYMDLLEQDGTPVLLGRRVTPGWALNLAKHPENDIDGLLKVSNIPDPYSRDALGNELTVTYYPIDALKPPPPEDFAGVVVDLGG